MMVSIDGYPLDLVETEGHKLSSTIAEDPVEDGSVISDNIVAKPRELTLTNAVVSDTPTGVIASDPTRQLEPPTLPSQDCFGVLERIWLEKRVVTVVTGFKKYESMALEDLDVPRDAKTAGGLVFTAKFKHVVIKQNKRVTVATPNLGGKVKKGSKPAVDWARATGIDAIFVRSFPYATGPLSENGFYYLKNSGRQIVLSEVIGGTTFIRTKTIAGEAPDGYVLKGDYFPMTPDALILAEQRQSTLNAQGSGIAQKPVHYDPAGDQWLDDKDNSVTKTVPNSDQMWNQIADGGGTAPP